MWDPPFQSRFVKEVAQDSSLFVTFLFLFRKGKFIFRHTYLFLNKFDAHTRPHARILYLSSSASVPSSVCCSLAVNSSPSTKIHTGTPNTSRIQRRAGNLCSRFGWTNFSPPQVNTSTTFATTIGLGIPAHVCTHTYVRCLHRFANLPARRKRDYGSYIVYIYIYMHIHTYTYTSKHMHRHTCVHLCKYIFKARGVSKFFRVSGLTAGGKGGIYILPRFYMTV